tara:strand:- start:669 stop:821 length:153 start_codon:yes stop_codon:yes gene_type:complete
LEVEACVDLLFNTFKYNVFPIIEISAMIALLFFGVYLGRIEQYSAPISSN